MANLAVLLILRANRLQSILEGKDLDDILIF